ncbi:DUF2141 domain-containing protein [Aquimarina sp. AU474]|uniref:DUF2141 domain-containing protein n=1 Tax=Aquimarina sp. AU474 TaxID=2108529 RepID=UPI000D69054A|nr:DUF2141 domain-containing protein [Aquimarina sp. AU474]
MKTKHYIVLVFALVLSITSTAQNTLQSIEVTITNVQTDEGTIMIGLYNAESNFLNKPYKSISIKANKGPLKASFKNILEGEYAISLYHDQNNNNELDTNFFGIPKEPYGTSNNAKGRFGPPKWVDAKFLVSKKTVIQSISL